MGLSGSLVADMARLYASLNQMQGFAGFFSSTGLDVMDWFASRWRADLYFGGKEAGLQLWSSLREVQLANL